MCRLRREREEVSPAEELEEVLVEDVYLAVTYYYNISLLNCLSRLRYARCDGNNVRDSQDRIFLAQVRWLLERIPVAPGREKMTRFNFDSEFRAEIFTSFLRSCAKDSSAKG